MRILLTLLLGVVSLSAAFAQGGILKPVKWSSSTKHVQDDVFEFIFDAKIDDGWSTYSQTSDIDGPIPTSVNFDESPAFELVGNATEIGDKKEAPEPLFDNIVVSKYTKKVTFVQKVKVLEYGKPDHRLRKLYGLQRSGLHPSDGLRI